MQIFSNNGATTLAVAVNALDTTITVVDASKFPVGEFKVTLETVDRSKNEIVLVTGVVGNVLTVVRAQEGTVATDFPVDAKVENRVTAEWLNALQTTVDGMVDDTTASTTKTWSSSKVSAELDTKQATLVSGTNIKTINSTSLLGSGNITTPTTTVNNTLTSTSTTEALSAAQGKVLQDSKAPLASPALTGTPTAPTAAVGTNTTQLATTAFVNTEIANDAVLKTGATMTGAITSLRETIVAMPANDINLTTGNFFTKRITAATTFTVSNVPTTGQAISFILELTNGGAATITWFSGVKWAGGTAPTLTASGVDFLGFYSHDGGTTWRGILMSKDSK